MAAGDARAGYAKAAQPEPPTWATAQSDPGPAGVAQSEARLLASGALLQQAAQGAGLLALLTIVTILARRLSVSELGAYGLVASLAGYLLVLRNSVASSAVRAMAGAVDRDERGRVFCAAAALYTAAGLATGVLIARRRAADRGADPRRVAGRRRTGGRRSASAP